MKYNIDWSRYGTLIRMRRYERGYRKGSDFIKAFQEILPMSLPTLYKIERGNQPPSVEQYLSLNDFLFGSPILPEDVFKLCLKLDTNIVTVD